MFTTRFNKLIDALDIKLLTLAVYSGIDHSNISRFKSGKRIPKKKGSAANKLAEGIRRLAHDEHITDDLCDIIGCNSSATNRTIDTHILNYLYDVSDLKYDSSNRNIFPNFSDRLDYIMTIADLSNSDLSRLIHVDPSLISRYRRGKRLPSVKGENSVVKNMCNALYNSVIANGAESELCNLIGISPDDLSQEEVTLWLFEPKIYNNLSIQFSHNIVENYISYGTQSGISLPDYTDIFSDYRVNDKTDIYFGINGIQDVVIRFLIDVINNNEASELYLYSEHPTDWLDEDRSFMVKWAVLMNECVKRNIKIRIIHNINRDLKEMSSAIQSWLPLYMSGMIESYYSKRQIISRFQHTIFLCPGQAAVCGFSAKGVDKSSVMYKYIEDRKCLDSLMATYDRLMQGSNPMIQVGEHFEERPIEDDSVIILDGKPFTNIRIYIDSKQVIIKSKTGTTKSFKLSHPLMCKSFKTYANSALTPPQTVQKLRFYAVCKALFVTKNQIFSLEIISEMGAHFRIQHSLDVIAQFNPCQPLIMSLITKFA